jgi:hypothetical protein
VSASIDIWVAAILTLAMLSMTLYKVNPVYKAAEHAFIGIGIGHTLVTAIQVIQTSGINPIVQNGEIRLIIPLLFGFLFFFGYSKKYAYLSRSATALIVGTGAGLGLAGAVKAQFLDQITATFLPLNSINNLILIIGFLTGVSYFLMTRKYTRYLEGPASIVPRAGRWFLMIAFGASFGNASMGFLSMLLGRVLFLVRDWLGISKLM